MQLRWILLAQAPARHRLVLLFLLAPLTEFVLLYLGYEVLHSLQLLHVCVRRLIVSNFSKGRTRIFLTRRSDGGALAHRHWLLQTRVLHALARVSLPATIALHARYEVLVVSRTAHFISIQL